MINNNLRKIWITKTILLILMIGAVGITNVKAQNSAPTGAINGKFTINASGDQVCFSQGNLQYQASTNTWRFAENQYDYIGSDNNNISENYSGWIDLFGWGTSGYHDTSDQYNVNYQPWSTSKSTVNSNYNYFGYGPSTKMTDKNLTGASANYDWGVYNPISNGGNTVNQWRTLTKSEWFYVINTRTTTSGIRYAKANVNDVDGVILLPDDWNESIYNLSNTNTSNSSFSSNIISATEWITIESAGAVFLPAAGSRSGTTLYDSGGVYYSASYYDKQSAYIMSFYDSSLGANNSSYRYGGCSIRLVRTMNYTIQAMPNSIKRGLVSGDGSYYLGQNCTLTATANEGYTFVNWTENDVVVSTEATYTFTVTEDRSLVANFTPNGGNVFAGAINGLFSVSADQQVVFSQGNLQFQASTNIWSFAENQWDYVGSQNPNYGQDPGGTVSGSDNTNISSTYNGWIDLFGWGTSGYNHGAECYQPWSTLNLNSCYYAYGNSWYNLYSQTGQADWGWNEILNGGNQEESGWRTPTNEEWLYLFNTRNTTSGIRYASSQVNGVNGVILLPDDWDANYYSLNNTNIAASYSSNVISISQWAILELHGAVFLPAAGLRNNETSVYDVGYEGYYWSSTNYNGDNAYFIKLLDFRSLNYQKYYGQSVRLVKSVKTYSLIIPGYGTGNDKWSFISSPLVESTAPDATSIENLFSASEYDLYRFNQAANGAEWENYKAHTQDFELENGQGYLYASKEDVNVIFKGTFNEGTSQTVSLECSGNGNLKGYNLVGNPFPVNAYSSRPYYVMNDAGDAVIATVGSTNEPIAPCTGILVRALENEVNPTVTFSTTQPRESSKGTINISLGQQINDRITILDNAIISFNDGDQLDKYVLNANNAKIYIPQRGKDYAIVIASRESEMPININVTQNGEYTINVTPNDVEMDYLHLIDHFTGADVDLLQTSSYSFSAKDDDNASRFFLAFKAKAFDGE